MRIDVKKQLKSINEALKKSDILRSQYNEIEEVDEAQINQINDELSILNERINDYKNAGNQTLIKEKMVELAEVKKNFKESKINKQNQITNEITELTNQIKELKKNHEQLLKERTTELNNKISNLSVTIKQLENEINSKESEKNNLRSRLTFIQTSAKQTRESKARYEKLMLETKSKEFSGYVTCPDCGKEFAPNEDELNQFIERKNKDIKYCVNEIAHANLAIENLVTEVSEIRTKAHSIDTQIADLMASKISNEETLKSLKEELENVIDTTPSVAPNIENIQSKIDKLNDKLNEVINSNYGDDERIVEIQDTINDLENSSGFEEELKQANEELKALELKKKELYVAQSKWESKVQFDKEYNDNIKKLNDTEALLSRVEAFIHKMIECINYKAKELTGLDFVMLEEYVGNDNVKEVCYATINGVAFANVNTAQKYITGIQFIERIKDIAERKGVGKNTLPILADKFEGIDSIDKIKSLAKEEQLICSRVTEDTEMRFI